jgi:hypothetical protein
LTFETPKIFIMDVEYVALALIVTALDALAADTDGSLTPPFA